ncbi:MAG: DUF3090 family protein [Actinobacteria bacterium]|nr:DUF3090 family protein [Actinomycetota bacterium]
MADDIEFDEIDALAAGAVGEPGEREFFIQARTESTQLTVLVEKEQVALLAAEAITFLDRIADDFPEDDDEAPKQDLREPTVPLFRARLIGLGFDPERARVLIELRERPSGEEEEDEGELPAGERASAGGVTPPAASEPMEMEEEGYVARIYATRSQVRAMAARGAAAVAAGRPPCPLCDMPMDPAGHRCPRWN